MPSRLDPLLMLSDTIELATEHPYLDPDLVVGLYHHLATVRERQPSLDEARQYVSRITSVVPEDTIRAHLGGAEIAPEVQVRQVSPRTASPPDTPATPRPPGRPGWTPELFWEHYRAAYDSVDPPRTQRSVAEQFVSLDGERGIDPDHLRKLVARFKVPAV